MDLAHELSTDCWCNPTVETVSAVEPIEPSPTLDERVTMIERFLALSIMPNRFDSKYVGSDPELDQEWRRLRQRFQPDKL